MDTELLTLLSLSSHGAAGRFRSEEVLCQQESLRSRKRRKERSDPSIITRKSEPAAIPLASAGFLSHQDWGKQGLREENTRLCLTSPWPGEVEGTGTPAESKGHMEMVLTEGGGHWVGPYITWTLGNWETSEKGKENLEQRCKRMGRLKRQNSNLMW